MASRRWRYIVGAGWEGGHAGVRKGDERDGGERGAQEAVEDKGLDVECSLISDFLFVIPADNPLSC